MTASIILTKRICRYIHHLNPGNNRQHRSLYEKFRYEFIRNNEGHRQWVYDDGKGNKTVGIGFNMQHSGASNEWRNIFKGKISFDDVYYAKRPLQDAEIQTLFQHSIYIREYQLKNIYKKVWHRLAPNECLAIEDAYFNGPNLVRGPNNNLPPTKFFVNIHKYISNNNLRYLYKSATELLYHSNALLNKGIQNRRQVQAIMLTGGLPPFHY